MNTKLSVLICEDSLDIAAQLADFLSDKGFTTDNATTGKQALNLIQQHHYDLVILDIMLPDTSGYQLCAQLKNLSATHLPVLMLTARDSLSDKIEGFAKGADDYLTKPFALEEVYMRSLALSRRTLLHQNKEIQLGDLKVNLTAYEVSRQGRPISLSQIDFTILQALVLAYPDAISKRQLVSKVWGDDAPETDALRSHVYTLRNALDKPFDKAMIKTVHGIGFKLELGSD